MWPSESPWLIIGLSVLGLVICSLTWMSRQHWGAIAAAVGFAILGIGGVVYDQFVVTPREQVEDAILQITGAFQKRDLDRTLSFISDSAWDVRLLAAEGYNLVMVDDGMRVTDIQVETLAQDQRARSQFRVNGNATYKLGGGSRFATMWEAKWERETDGWKMIEIIALDPMTGNQQPFLESHRERVRRLYPRQ